MTSLLLRAALAGLALLAAGAADAKPVADAAGMTLYTYDPDAGGAPTCYGDCATHWPPYLGAADAALTEGWTLVDRTDGTKQWAYDGNPVYAFQGDAAPGDVNGDGMGGVWHMIDE